MCTYPHIFQMMVSGSFVWHFSYCLARRILRCVYRSFGLRTWNCGGNDGAIYVAILNYDIILSFLSYCHWGDHVYDIIITKVGCMWAQGLSFVNEFFFVLLVYFMQNINLQVSLLYYHWQKQLSEFMVTMNSKNLLEC